MTSLARASAKYFLCVLLLSACSNSDESFELYTVSGVAYNLEEPFTLGINGEHLYQVKPSHRSYTEFSYSIPESELSVEGFVIAEQPASQFCSIESSVDEESAAVDMVLRCQSYRYGPKGVSDFAVSSDRTCAAIGSKVECWGEFNGTSEIDFSAEYKNPRLLTLNEGGHFCFLDDTNLHCSNNELFDASEVYGNAANIREMEMNYRGLCYIDDGGVSCVGDFSRLGPFSNIDSPSQLSTSEFTTCVLDAEGKPHCWGRLAEPLEPNDGVFETIGVSKFEVCGYGSEGVKCSLSRYGYLPDEQQARIGTVIDFVMAGFNNCAISLSGPVCWDTEFPSELLVFENVFNQPVKVEYSQTETSKGCGLEGDQLICFGIGYREFDIE